MKSFTTEWKKLAVASAIVPILILSSCSSTSSDSASSGAPSPDQAASCIPDGQFDPNTDYFPDKASFDYATGVKVEYHNSYKVVTIDRASPESNTPVSYVLVQCGAPAPKLSGDLADAQQVTVPVKRAALASTTMLKPFLMLNSLDTIKGVNSGSMIWDSTVRDKVTSGDIGEFGVGDGKTGVDPEKLVALNPDLYMISSQSGAPEFSKMQEAKVPVVVEPDWLETTPLGRAEYLKYISLFLDKEKDATQQFDGIATRYNDVKEKAADVTTHPSVINSSQFNGVWYITSNDSYSVQFLRDAGADYVFSDVTGSAPAQYDTEQVLTKASNADFWLNSNYNSLSDAVAADSRLGKIKAVKEGNLWNPSLQSDPKKGNNFWEAGPMEPDLILGDLIALLHPELDPDHEFSYYQKASA